MTHLWRVRALYRNVLKASQCRNVIDFAVLLLSCLPLYPKRIMCIKFVSLSSKKHFQIHCKFVNLIS